MTLAKSAALVIRATAAFSLVRGLMKAGIVLGLGGGTPFEALATAEQARIVAFALAELAAGTALWLLAPWGVVLWSAVTVVQVATTALGGDFVAASGHVLLGLAVLAAVRASRRAEKRDTFRFS